ncbi:adenylate/guanylate cyclase domain-containing protein [Marinifilum sp. D714]|uniref:adenylate/guanylate cyclase domain-containing protein n=1 Tax=Marinifilum sp. D714 TaxID=2937523 RepID=UPI0027CD41C0|nr:adenylate/guanylate cyclase domain-containing protein [Marinifilum sp. D714]MDQ2180713.1 HD domain-containing protein [Marinifilum sp. D714]
MTHYTLCILLAKSGIILRILGQVEVGLFSQNLILFALLLPIIVVFLFLWFRIELRRQRSELEREFYNKNQELIFKKEKAEKLLANLLPKQTAEELQSKGKVSSRRFRMVTVLFSDIHGFTKIVEQMNPEDLIDELDKFFMHFDSVVEKYNIEKIKTVGDAYMCAGGIPNKNRTNPIEVILAALEIQQYMNNMKINSKDGKKAIWGLRIGIHTGPVIAGVVGTKKISYDIWGDTVNTASRMESSGAVGEINISGMTYMLVKDFFICEYRGRMPVKYKGNIDMYFVKGFLPNMSADLKGLIPNDYFLTSFQILRYDDLEETILTKMENELPKNLYYHNLKHTIDVITEVEIIGRKEGITEAEMLIIKTAALFHDTGFILSYNDHEEFGVKLARHILPQYKYTEKQIDEVSNLIMHTKHPPQPESLLEMIMCDADLDYLGRTDFIPVSGNLYRELKEYGKIKSIDEWNRLQIRFIENHQYFTKTARNMRNVNKYKQLEKLRELI